MLNQLQQAYNEGLKNLVFVDFSNKKVAGEMKKSELELANQKACCEDVMQAIALLIRKGDFDSVRERLGALEKSVDYMEQLENHIKEQRRSRFYEIANSLSEQGWSAKVVKSNANQN
ncbi:MULTISPECIES: hypothetical protein [unclassified Lysinibacillus]|uniref:hypothetical protein n=1 Tax=unclassified Lysinibacillus TaxID=2636778 RepID=UPI0030F4DBF9